MHIPGGVLATKIGMKRALVLGLLVQGAAGVMSGLSYSYVELAIFRVASGVGGSVFVAMTAASMVVLLLIGGVGLEGSITAGGRAPGGGLEPPSIRIQSPAFFQLNYPGTIEGRPTGRP